MNLMMHLQPLMALKKVKFDMIAKLENLGPFHFFFTLSCMDTRYDENFTSFLVENVYKIQYFTNEDGTTTTKVKGKDGRDLDKTLEQFLSEEVNESLP
jgi:hypothetical protein